MRRGLQIIVIGLVLLAAAGSGVVVGQQVYTYSVNMQRGETAVVTCSGAQRLRSDRVNDLTMLLACGQAVQPTVAPTSTTAPPTATALPTAVATNTPAPTPTPGTPGSVPDWSSAAGMTGEYGMAPAVYAQLRADAASGRYDRPCTDEEHDSTQWHTLINYAANCHYDHQHGDSPYAVADLFGPVGAAFGITQTISYPWQTYAAGADSQPVQPIRWENTYKHEGYYWIVRRDQCRNASDRRYCVDAFRIQTHNHGPNLDTNIRWHSFSAEIRVCTDGNNPATCRNAQLGGWIDTFALFTPSYESSAPGLCDNRFNAAYYGGVNSDQINDFGLSQQFVPRNDPDLQDEFRCHRRLPTSFLTRWPSGLPQNDVSFSPPVEWWHHTLFDFRFNTFIYNPFAEVTPDNAIRYYCGVNDATCRWTQSRFTANVDYVFPVMSWHVGVRGWMTRFGNNGRGCTGPALDCIWVDYSQVQRNPNGLGYIHTRDGERQSGGQTQPHDYDVTPAGVPSWIRWFWDMH